MTRMCLFRSCSNENGKPIARRPLHYLALRYKLLHFTTVTDGTSVRAAQCLYLMYVSVLEKAEGADVGTKLRHRSPTPKPSGLINGPVPPGRQITVTDSACLGFKLLVLDLNCLS